MSGYKSFGIDVGNLGQVNLEQGLDVRIGGELKPQTSVSAHLSDQGSSLDGTTREISDFDMIYLSLEDPSYGAVAGDQYVAWPFKGLVSGQKKIKGLSATFSPGRTPFSIGAFGALSGGKTVIETRQGRTGIQGPYYLKGRGEKEFIQPLSGTVSIRLNGKELEEGIDKDFFVDYELGTVTFTPRHLIKDEDLIRIEYEYRLFNYQRTLLGGTAGTADADSLFSVQGVFWSEQDNKNHPIDLTLNSSDIDALVRAGDRIPDASTARPVHPNDVAGESELYPLYKRQYTGSDSFFVYTPYNRTAPDSVLNYYYVWFRPVETGESGDYDSLFTDHRGTIYGFVGRNAGGFTDRARIPAPAAQRAGELKTAIRIPGFSATLNIAGQDHDRNLFSSLDDNNNLASATAFSFLAGSRQRSQRGAWISGSHRFTSRRFDAEVLSAHERKEQWDDIRLAVEPAERHFWDATVGVTPLHNVQSSLSCGQNLTNGESVTDKISPAASSVLFDDRLLLDYAGSFFRRHEAQDKGTGRREYGSATLRLPRNVIGLQYRDEWRSDTLDNGSGLYEGGCTWNLIPLWLNEKLSFISRRKSQDGRFWSVDTGYTIRWEQSLDYSFFPSWRLKGLSSIDRTIDYATGRDITMLMDLTSEIEPKSRGFETKQRYRISSEIASSFIQVPVFAGKGMGTHIYDSTRREYVPRQPGDYFMQQREVYDSSANLRVRKSSLDLSWSFEPRKPLAGILNDLVWQGMLFFEEHVDAQSGRPSSYLPGYTSLGGQNRSTVRYADLSYRQELEWLPRRDSTEPPRVRLAVTPAFRKIRGYEETGIESRLEIDRPIGRWTLGSALNLLELIHDDSLSAAADYRVYDRRIELSQHYRPVSSVTLSLLEVTGLARKRAGLESGRVMLLDSSFYYQIAPSLSWLPNSRGRVSAQYTYSVVPLQGDVDFRMARGFMAGVSHQASITTDVRMGERFLVLGSYRGDLRKPQQATDFEPANHLFSLEVRVFL